MANHNSGPNIRTAVTFSIGSTKNAIRHLLVVHHINQNGDLPPVQLQQQTLQASFGNTLPRVNFNSDVFKNILIRWMIICNIPFIAVENPTFRLLLAYLAACVRRFPIFLILDYILTFKTASYTAIPKNLPRSDNTIRSWILDLYKQSHISIRNLINMTDTAVHISLDLWTSPNHRSFLAVVGHMVIGVEVKTCHTSKVKHPIL
jgi:hypothetical protein